MEVADEIGISQPRSHAWKRLLWVLENATTRLPPVSGGWVNGCGVDTGGAGIQVIRGNKQTAGGENMIRISDLPAEVVNVNDGKRLGLIGDLELIWNKER